MKKLLLATAVAVAGTSVSAMDIGYGLSIGATTDMSYTIEMDDIFDDENENTN